MEDYGTPQEWTRTYQIQQEKLLKEMNKISKEIKEKEKIKEQLNEELFRLQNSCQRKRKELEDYLISQKINDFEKIIVNTVYDNSRMALLPFGAKIVVKPIEINIADTTIADYFRKIYKEVNYE